MGFCFSEIAVSEENEKLRNSGNAQKVYGHISRKYGTNGYAKYPEIYQKIFSEELAKFRRLADELTVEKISEIWVQNESNMRA